MQAIARFTICLIVVFSIQLFSQTPTPPGQTSPASGAANRAIPIQPAPPTEEVPKRIFWIIPNYRSHASFRDAKPLTSKEKFRIAARDSYDPGNLVLVGAIAGFAQLSNSTRSYGQGAEGYGKYYGSTFGDVMIGNVMTTGVYPSLLHQDPRYFRRGTGSAWSRLGYAMGQIFITHGDNRKTQINYSEFCGNATAVAISNAYNPDNRTASDAAGKFGMQIGLDMAGNILKEFAPDVSRKFFRKKRASSH
jgi:hypothetical protein